MQVLVFTIVSPNITAASFTSRMLHHDSDGLHSCIKYVVADSITKVALLGIGHWAFRYTELTAIIWFSDHRTIAALCAIPKMQNLLY